MRATENFNTCKKITLTIHFQVVNYVLEAYETNDVIEEAEADVIHYMEPGICPPLATSGNSAEKH